MMKHVKKHARFAAVLIVLLVILIVASGEFSDLSLSLDSKQAQARTLFTTNYRALFSDAVKFKGEPATMQGRRIQDRTQAINQVSTARNERLAFVYAPDYTLAVLPENANEGDQFQHFTQLMLDLKRQLGYQRYFTQDVNARKAFGFQVPEDRADIKSSDVERFLKMLDIVRCVAGSVERSKVTELNELDFRAVDDQLDKRGVPTKPAAANEQPFMSGTALRMKIRATEESLYNFMIDLQRPVKGDMKNRYLAIEDFKFEKADLLQPQDNLIDASLTVVAYQINEQSTYPADDSAKKQEQQTNQPRRFR
ncbi:MAG: hypothetical protein IT464_00895 [Planctomycetes bacterium]|nr:hypothetical protein [Planctomycetota bacterium]